MQRKFLIKLFAWIVLWVLSIIVFPIAKSKAEAPEVKLSEQPIENIVTYFAKENGVDTKLALAVMRCESNGKQNTVSDGGRSKGIFQYQSPTWERHSKEYGEKLDINSPYDQAKLAMWAIADGKGNEWTAYTTIQKGGTYSFYSRQLKKHFTVTCNLAS